MAYVEFLIIGILAFMIIGPKDFPEAVYGFVKALRKMRSFCHESLTFFYPINEFSIPLEPVNHSFEEIEEPFFFSNRKFCKIESSDPSLRVLSIANQDRV